MDARGGKLLEFLKANNHLDLEVPDIAFSVKKSEKTVEAALQKLQQKGLVTARQNEYGRVYWYALPSAPITRSFKLEELTTVGKKDDTVMTDMDDEVDLSDLQNASVEEKKKSHFFPIKESVGKSRDTIKFSTDIPEEEFIPSPLPEETVVTPEPDVPTFHTTGQVEEPISQSGKRHDIGDVEEKIKNHTFNYSSLLLPITIIMVLISLGSLLQSSRVTKKMKNIESAIPKDIVTDSALSPLTHEVNKIEELEKKVAQLTLKIDSLKTQLEQMSAQQGTSLQKRKALSRRRTTHRKRR